MSPFTSASFSPREIVSELDRYIIGQNAAMHEISVSSRFATYMSL